MSCFKVCCKTSSSSLTVKNNNKLKPKIEKTANKISLCCILFWLLQTICSGIKRCFFGTQKNKKTKSEAVKKTDKLSQEFLYKKYINSKEFGSEETCLKESSVLNKLFFNKEGLSHLIQDKIFFKNLCNFCLNHHNRFQDLPLYINWDFLITDFPQETSNVISTLLSNYDFYLSVFVNRGNDTLYDNTYPNPEKENKDYTITIKHPSKIIFDILLQNDFYIFKLVVKNLIKEKNSAAFLMFDLLNKDVRKIEKSFNGLITTEHGYQLDELSKQLPIWSSLAKENLLEPLYAIDNEEFSKKLKVALSFTYSSSQIIEFFEIIRKSENQNLTKIVFSSLYSFTEKTELLFPLFENAILQDDTKLYWDLKKYYLDIIDVNKLENLTKKFIKEHDVKD